MKEIEIKILDINLEEVQQKLLSIGVEKVGEYQVRDEFYDFPDKHIRGSGEVLRLRSLDGKAFLTYKSSRIKDDTFKIREEAETEIFDADEMRNIFKLCGLHFQKVLEKRRISFRRDDVFIEIDQFDGIPPFLEIESPNKDSIEKLVKDIGYTMEQTTSESIRKVLAHYGLDDKK